MRSLIIRQFFAPRTVSFAIVWQAAFLGVMAASGLAAGKDGSPVNFLRDIQPILSQKCFSCHGPDESSREAGLRLDRSDGATVELESGSRAIVPGHPEESELISRVTTTEDYLRMPPAGSGHTLSAKEIADLRTWIKAGAPYEAHWSFRPIADDHPPSVNKTAWVRNPIDQFVLARLEQQQIDPSPEADRATLLRRLSLDLRGLPPDVKEFEAFVNDDSPDAYEQLVDRMLASPLFGERWGRHWLDLAHYADSDGYLGDALRPNAWLYRDWVIQAINDDMPFDRFTIEQLAGDLLPDSTLAQKTATGFLRNTLRNTEAGVDLEEYRLKEIVDRVNTVGVGWMGLSLGCAECHSHKFDPISHQEFYQFFSFFNNADDTNVTVPQPKEEAEYRQKLSVWKKSADGLEAQLAERLKERESSKEVIAPADLVKVLSTTARRRSSADKKLLAKVAEWEDAELDQLCRAVERHAAGKPVPPSLKAMTVAARKEARISYIHLRGDYRSRGEDVVSDTPEVLPALQPRESAADRLDLARWLVRDDHPLTSRVIVNRMWMHLFGRGLVSTVDNFGSGGAPPSHPQLLDWLASEQMRRGWSRKDLIRLIVTSATYRQLSHQRAELEERDPFNELLARQGRFRLESEAIRDAALATSNLLEIRLGGPGIRPPQPAYIASISRNADWKVTTGPELYRRGMYILFRRATPYPMLLTFDSPDSTAACVQRQRSNSPLQALTLLNDPVFFECAQSLGRHLARLARQSEQSPFRAAIRICLSREARPGELERLRKLYDERRLAFQFDPAAARAVLGNNSENDAISTGNTSRSTAANADLAAWIVTARVLMNLDEFITRE